MRSRAPAGLRDARPRRVEPRGLRPRRRSGHIVEQVDVRAPRLLELIEPLHPLGPRSAPTGSRRLDHDRFAYVPYRTSPRTRSRIRRGEEDAQSGRLPSNRRAPRTRCPTASITARTSSIARLEIGQADVAVREPGPALVEPDQPRERPEAVVDVRATPTMSQSISRWEKNPWIKTRSNGPSPVTWYAMLTSPLRAYSIGSSCSP